MQASRRLGRAWRPAAVRGGVPRAALSGGGEGEKRRPLSERAELPLEDVHALARRARFRVVSDEEDEAAAAASSAAAAARAEGRAVVVFLGWARDPAHGQTVEAVYRGEEGGGRLLVPFYTPLRHCLHPGASRLRATTLASRVDDELSFLPERTPVFFHCSSLAGAYTLAAVLRDVAGQVLCEDAEAEDDVAARKPLKCLTLDRVAGVLFEGGPGVLDPRVATEEARAAASVEPGRALNLREPGGGADPAWALASAYFSRSMRRDVRRRHLDALTETLLAGMPPQARQTLVADPADELVPAAEVAEYAALQRAAGRAVDVIDLGPHGSHLGAARDERYGARVLQAVAEAERAWAEAARQ